MKMITYLSIEDLGHLVEVENDEFLINLPNVADHTWTIEGVQPSEMKALFPNCSTPSWDICDIPELLEGETVSIVAKLVPDAVTTPSEVVYAELPFFVKRAQE